MREKKSRFALLSIAVGFWLIAINLTFSLSSRPLFLSDILSGVVVIALGILSLAAHRIWSGWAIGGIGVWLQLAPLVFWAPTSFIYLNETLSGVLLIAFSFPIASSRLSESESVAAYPKGWSYNPSSWLPRILSVCLALLCWTFSRYLAAYQLGYIDQMWDPVFHNGTLRVITSQISHDFPLSDAGLGACAYTLEFLLGWHGGSRRWHTMPWIVLSFGFLVVPVGLASIILIILQPVVVGAWCFWCLLTAACMLGMILLSGSEMVATLGMLKEASKDGQSVWTVLWKGKKECGQLTPSKPRNKRKAAWGFYPCWNLIVLVFLGVYLMLSPYLYGVAGTLATACYIVGPLIIAFSVISMVEVFRTVRLIHLLLGIVLVSISLFGANFQNFLMWHTVVLGILAILLALPRGAIVERYGSWESWIY